MTNRSEPLAELVAVAKALSDPGRVRIVGALRGGELCVCQLIELLGLAPSTVSKHLTLLRQAGLLAHRRDGRWAYYRLAGRNASRTARRALSLVNDSLADDGRCRADEVRLERILRVDPEVLCCRRRAPTRAICVDSA